MSFSLLRYSKTLQVFRGNQRRRAQREHGGAAGDGPTADLRQQLQRERLQDHHSQGRHQQNGGLRGEMVLRFTSVHTVSDVEILIPNHH